MGTGRGGKGTAVDLAIMTAIGGGFLFTVAAVIPWHMDEFLGYHLLACHWYPGNMVNVFRSSCTELGLAPWGDTLLPLRAYTYTGSLPGALYLPIFALWPSPLSARLLGLFALAAQALLLQRLFKIRSAVSFIILLSFLSYSAIQIFDLGPVSLQLTLLIASYLALRRWRELAAKDTASSIGYPGYLVAAGLMAFVGIWNKVAFFFVLPSVLLLALVFASEVIRKARTAGARARAAVAIAGGCLAFSLPTLLLLFATTAAGTPYYQVITGTPLFTELAVLEANFAARLLPFLLNPLRSSHLFLWDPRPATAAGLALVALVTAIVGYGFWAARDRRDGSSRRAIWLLAAWLLSLALVAMSSKSHAAHHLQLGLPFLILAAYELLAPISKRRSTRLLVVLFVLLNSLLYFQFTELRHQRVGYRANADLATINDELNERFGERYLIVCVDWGLYYFKSLYGPREQAVVHFWGLKRRGQLRRVQQTADRLGRKLVFVGRQQYSRSDWQLITSGVEGLIEEQLPWDRGRWRLAFQPES